MPSSLWNRPSLTAVLFLGSTALGAVEGLSTVVTNALRVPIPDTAALTAALRPGHPRLIITPERLAEMRALVLQDARAAAWYAATRARAQALLPVPPIAYVTDPDGNAQNDPMLNQGRDLVERIWILGVVARIDRDAAAFARLRAEVLNVLDSWPDWPGDLVRYEVASGMALAYDWFTDRWTASEQERMVAALRDRVLKPFNNDRFAAWNRQSAMEGIRLNNVTLVLNAGAAVAAMALHGEVPALPEQALGGALAMLQVTMPRFGNDGVWEEGPTYGAFVIRHLTQTLASLDTAYGQDFGLISSHRFPGVEAAAGFFVSATGPTRTLFNYGDATDSVFSSASLLWLGDRYNCPAAVAFEADAPPNANLGNVGREIAMRIAYYRPPVATIPAPPRERHFPEAQVGTLRSGWDANAVFVAVKGGGAKGNIHGQLDGGSFVIDALGRRWIGELGPGNYTDEYFSYWRYFLFKARTESQNTLVIDQGSGVGSNQEQVEPAKGGILAPIMATDAEWAKAPGYDVDLTRLYSTLAMDRIMRTVQLTTDRKRVLVRDMIHVGFPSIIRWQAYTQAPVQKLNADGTLDLAYPGAPERMRLRLNTPDKSLRFSLAPAAPWPNSLAGDRDPVAGWTRIAVVIPTTSDAGLDVEFIPLPGKPQAVAITSPAPLMGWIYQPGLPPVTATATYQAGGTTGGLGKWTSSDPQVASVVEVTDSNGQSTARITCIGPGSADITFSAKADGTYTAGSATLPVTVVSDPRTHFVFRFYQEVLNRTPDANGFKGWVADLEARRTAGADLAYGFVLSPEFTGRAVGDADFVTTLYQAFFGRVPDPLGKDAWLVQLAAGQLREDVLYGFLFAPEFAALAGKSGLAATSPGIVRRRTIRAFAARFYTEVLGRPAEEAGLATWTDALLGGTVTGEALAQGFVLGAEFTNRQLTDAQFISTLYRSFFNRGADPAGASGWLQALGPGRKTRAQVLAGFTRAAEFTALCRASGIIAFPGSG